MLGVQLPAARDVSGDALHKMEVLFSAQSSGGCFRLCEIASSLLLFPKVKKVSVKTVGWKAM